MSRKELFDQFYIELNKLIPIRERLFAEDHILAARHLFAVTCGYVNPIGFDSGSDIPRFVADGIDDWLERHGPLISEFERRLMIKCRDAGNAALRAR